MKPIHTVLKLAILLYIAVRSCGLLDEFDVDCSRLKNRCDKRGRHAGTQQTIHFGLMLAFPDPQKRPSLNSAFNDGHDIAPAVYLAAKQVNNRSDLLKDYQIKISRFDGGCNNTATTMIGINELVCSCQPIVGIIGPGCEISSRIVSQLTNKNAFSVITVNFGGHKLSVGNHRYSFSILGPNSMYSKAIVCLMKYNNWTNSALLNSQISNPSGTNLDLQFNFTIIMVVYETHIPLQEIKESFSRIIIINTSPETRLKILCMAYHEGMVFPKYQWVFLEATDNDLHEISFTYDGKSYHCSDSEISKILNGSINFFLDSLVANLDNVTTAGYTLKEYTEQYELQRVQYSKEFNVTSQFSSWARGFYDAVWVLAFALNYSLIDINMRFTDIKSGSQMLAENIRKHILNLNIQGVTGSIKFDVSGYNREQILRISQYHGQNRTWKKFALYEGDEINVLPNVFPVFINDSFEVHYIQIDSGVAAGVLIFTALSLILAITAHGLNIYYRNHKVFKASSPSLNHLLFLGCYMIITGIVIHVVEKFKAINEGLQVVFCNSIPYLLSVGVTLFIGTVCVKTWRLNQLYVHSKKLVRGRIRCVSDRSLFGLVSILVVIDVLMCIVWSIVDPLQVRQEKRLDEKKTMPALIVNRVCHSNHPIYWSLVLIIPKIFIMLASFLLAVSTKIERKEFTTNNVIILTYFIAVIFGLACPVYVISYVTNISDSIQIMSLSIGLNISVCICVLLLLLPFFHDFCKKKYHKSIHNSNVLWSYSVFLT